jgi:hypothetical protein
MNAIPLNADHYDERLPRNVKNNFFYYIVATDTSYNRSKPSQFVFGKMPDILPPEKPFIQSISYEKEFIIVNWIRNVDSDLAGYHLYRSDSAKNFQRVNVNPLGRETFRYVDRTHEPNRDYFYFLEAFDSAGNISIKSNEMFARRIAKVEIENGPPITLNTKLRKAKNQLHLQWDYNEDLEEGNMMGYVVYRGHGEKQLRPITGLLKQKSFLDPIHKTNEQSVIELFYQVRAYVGNKIVYSKIVSNKF